METYAKRNNSFIELENNVPKEKKKKKRVIHKKISIKRNLRTIYKDEWRERSK